MRWSVGVVHHSKHSWYQSQAPSETHQDDVAERTSREQQVDPVLNLSELDVEAGRDDTALVDATVELDDDLARAVVVLKAADASEISRAQRFDVVNVQSPRTRQCSL